MQVLPSRGPEPLAGTRRLSQLCTSPSALRHRLLHRHRPSRRRRSQRCHRARHRHVHRQELKPFVDTEADLANQTGPLIWGHWFAKPRDDNWSIPAVELLGRYDPTVSNRYHGLFRDPAHSGVINPSQPKLVLGLTAADATLDYNFLQTPATVSAGYLLLDFEARAFMSELTVETDRLGTVGLSGIGFISPTGVFVSRSSSDRMAGASRGPGSTGLSQLIHERWSNGPEGATCRVVRHV